MPSRPSGKSFQQLGSTIAFTGRSPGSPSSSWLALCALHHLLLFLLCIEAYRLLAAPHGEQRPVRTFSVVVAASVLVHGFAAPGYGQSRRDSGVVIFRGGETPSVTNSRSGRGFIAGTSTKTTGEKTANRNGSPSNGALTVKSSLLREQAVARDLPSEAPLNQYELSGHYGPRLDPFNHHPAFHPGLDMEAPYGSTVYSTGAGAVIFTGTMDTYGRTVEIEHGHGITTRYAHLDRILVASGQMVGLHTPIGELGSTGRSTGPHLHYEVRVAGVAVDPAKFMQRGTGTVQTAGQR
jgi:murein DD-endopeptidase MepM/ murein hydrolase activator NlpD